MTTMFTISDNIAAYSGGFGIYISGTFIIDIYPTICSLTKYNIYLHYGRRSIEIAFLCSLHLDLLPNFPLNINSSTSASPVKIAINY